MRNGARKPLMDAIGIPARVFKAMRFPLISSAGGVPTCVILPVWETKSFVRGLTTYSDYQKLTYDLQSRSQRRTNLCKTSTQSSSQRPAGNSKGEHTCHLRVIRIFDRREIGHSRFTPIRVGPLGEKLIYRVQRIRLDGIVRGEHNKLGDLIRTEPAGGAGARAKTIWQSTTCRVAFVSIQRSAALGEHPVDADGGEVKECGGVDENIVHTRPVADLNPP